MSVITTSFIVLITVMVITFYKPAIMSCYPRPRDHRIRRGGSHQFYRGPILGHVLRGKDYRNQFTHSHLTCAGICLQEDACKSFNFCQDDRRCQLNSAVYSEDKSDLQPSGGCLYYDENLHGACQDIVSTTSSYIFPFPPLDSSQTFRLDFSAKGSHGARVGLSEQPNEDNYYEIVIGGQGSTSHSLIREDRFAHPINEAYVSVRTIGILDEHEYRRFWISYDEGAIQVGKGGEVAPFMKWNDTTRRVAVNYIGIRSHGQPTTWMFYTFCHE